MALVFTPSSKSPQCTEQHLSKPQVSCSWYEPCDHNDGEIGNREVAQE